MFSCSSVCAILVFNDICFCYISIMCLFISLKEKSDDCKIFAVKKLKSKQMTADLFMIMAHAYNNNCAAIQTSWD